MCAENDRDSERGENMEHSEIVEAVEEELLRLNHVECITVEDV
jgi:hypothetical protein